MNCWVLINRAAIAFLPIFLGLFALSFSPCARKASSSAPKISQKSLAEKCFAVCAPCHSSRQAKRRRQYFLYYQGVLCRIGGWQAAQTYWGSVHQNPCPRRRAYHSEPRKMADARPTFPLPQRYTLRKQKQFSRPMTGHTPQKLPFFRRNLLHHRSARAECPYTRSIMISPLPCFVNYFFQKIYNFFHIFSASLRPPKRAAKCRPFVPYTL